MEFEIRPASIFDLSSLNKLEHACFQQDAWPLFDLVAVLTFPDVVRLKAVIDGKLVAFIAGDPRPANQLAWIATLGVSPDFRMLGIGKSLLNACEINLKAPTIRLCVRPDNLPALQLYHGAGYQIVDRWDNYYNDKGDALVMEKKFD